MSQRITVTNLRNLCEHLNKITGSPVNGWERINGENRANIGHYHIDCAYGGYALERMVSEGGGVTQVISRGTARELYDQMHAFLRGFEAGEKYAKEHS